MAGQRRTWLIVVTLSRALGPVECGLEGLSMPRKDKVLVANGQGFWGDSILGPIRLVREGPLDYLTLDYLAEVTMSIMQKQRCAQPRGRATRPTSCSMIERILPELVEEGHQGRRQRRRRESARLHGRRDRGAAASTASSGVKVGSRRGRRHPRRARRADRERRGAPQHGHGRAARRPCATRVTSANVYLGAFPIAEALDQGAQIVITGRGTDPGLVLGPLIHEFGWKPTRLRPARRPARSPATSSSAARSARAATSPIGARCPTWRAIGYPIVEAHADGTFVITKHAGTGGLVDVEHGRAPARRTRWAIRARYLGPDCSADFTSLHARAGRAATACASRGVRGAAADADLQGLDQLPGRLEGASAS